MKTSGKILMLALITLSVICRAGESSAVDLDESWAIRHIQRMLARGASPYIEEGHNFYPRSILNRGELAVLVCRLMPNAFQEKEKYTEEYNAIYYFQEQKPDNFSEYRARPEFGFVEQAIRRAVIEPVEGEFSPEKAVTRGEFLKTVVIMLEKTTDSNCQIPGLALRAHELNKHLTRYNDVSIQPDDFPGWVKTAQEYNLLPKRFDDSVSLTGAGFNMGIPYRQVFFNPQKKNYEFGAGQPVTKELAMAILSNLFIKWDVYFEQVPFDVKVGNRSRDLITRMASDDSRVDSLIEKVDLARRTLNIRSRGRIEKKVGENTFSTLYDDRIEEIFVPEDIPVWLNYRGKWVEYNGKSNLARLEQDLKKLMDESIAKVGVNIVTRRKKYSWRDEEMLSVLNEENQPKKVRQAGYVEIYAVPYEFHGRIAAIKDDAVQINDYQRGEIILEVDGKTEVKRIITSDSSVKSGLDRYLDPSNSDLYTSPWKSLQVGEEVYASVDRREVTRAVKLTSYLRRAGTAVQVDLNDSRIITSGLIGGYFQAYGAVYNPDNNEGFKVLVVPAQSGEGKLKSGGMEQLYRDGAMIQNSVLYLQPASAVATPINQQVLPSNLLKFAFAVIR
ncbi:MAG: S-layer homology domain-containing protein [Candidatus Wallbacteria bacterium]|nr:S-layer homology domain-containing protein [Candidatus Wallbacteria bacterium]